MSSRKLYFRKSDTAFPGCDRSSGDASIKHTNGNTYTYISGLTTKNADRPSNRPNCDANINFQKFWHLVGAGGFRLPHAGASNNNSPLYVSMCFSGFQCEATQVRFDYKVYRGCHPGFYEDPAITWSKNTADGSANPEYCIQCPPGQYQEGRGAQKRSGAYVCKQCPQGKFGDESNVPGRDSVAYCARCPAGRYGDTEESTNPLCSGVCTAGYYCPSSGLLNTRPTGGALPTDPEFIVSAGYFGSAGASVATGTAECPAGYFCPAGTANTVCGTPGAPANCRRRCGFGESAANRQKYWCPARSSARQVVRPGFYSAGIGDPEHPEETRDQEKQCQPPNYCPGGTVGNGQEKPCPAGRFGTSVGLSASGCDGPCAPGFYCGAGSDQNDENRCGRAYTEDQQRVYCEPGSSTATLADPNHYTFCCAVHLDGVPCPDSQKIACPEDQRHYQAPCPTGFTCELGKLVTIKWRDDDNVGQCYADDINQPNIGVTKVNIAEGLPTASAPAVGAVAYEPTQGGSTPTTSNLGGLTYGMRANDGQGNLITTASAYSVSSATCQDPPSGTDVGSRFAIHWRSSSNDAFLATTQALAYAGPDGCKRYSVVVSAIAGAATGRCTLTVDVRNTNDPPAWDPNLLLSLAVPERSIAGTPVNLECLAFDGSSDFCDEIGTNSPNSNIDLVTDPDTGQDVIFEITDPRSGSYPSLTYPDGGSTTSKQTDEIFGVSGCTGDIFITEQASALLTFTVGQKYQLCIKACDDPAFFGLSPGQGLCAPPPNNPRCDANYCDDESACFSVYVTDVNDPPRWQADEAVKCDNDWRGEACVSDCCGMVKEKTEGATVLFGISPPYNRPTGTDWADWASDNLLNRDGSLAGNIILDPDGDELDFSIVCANCPGARTDLFFVQKVGGSSYYSVVAREPLKASGVLAYGSSNSISVTITADDDEFTDDLTLQIFIEDINEAPVFPSCDASNCVKFSEYENCQVSGATTSAPQAFASTDFTAADPEGSLTVLTYSVSGTPQNVGDSTDYTDTTLTAVQSSGNTWTLQTDSCLNYESVPADSASGGQHLVEVNVSVTDDAYTRTCVESGATAPFSSSELSHCTSESAALSATGTVRIEVLNVNEQVACGACVLTRSIQEDAAFGTAVVNASGALDPYSITDPDVGQTYSFAWSSDTDTVAQEFFNLDASTGTITTKKRQCSPVTALDVGRDSAEPACLDYYEDVTAVSAYNKQAYTLKVVIQDSLAPKTTATTTVTLSVSDVNEAPLVDENQGWSIAETTSSSDGWSQQLSATDPDEGTPPNSPTAITNQATWELASGHRYTDEVANITYTMFALSATGALTVAAAPSYPLDFESLQNYDLVVTYTDGGGLASGSRIVRIAILDINEAPVLQETTSQDASDISTWYSISVHKLLSDRLDCGGGSFDHTCATGACVDASTGEPTESGNAYCNTDANCTASNAVCASKVLKSGALAATDVDIDTTLRFITGERCRTTGGDFSACSDNAQYLRVNNVTGAVEVTRDDAGFSTSNAAGNDKLTDLDSQYRIKVTVSDLGTGGTTGAQRGLDSQWAPRSSATTVELYFKMIPSNLFPGFCADASTAYDQCQEQAAVMVTMREDEGDGYQVTTLYASDRNLNEPAPTDVITWNLLTLSNGAKSDPTMRDNTQGASLRGDKFNMATATGVSSDQGRKSTNTLQLSGEGIDFERFASSVTAASVSVSVNLGDGNGGTSRRRVVITIVDVNEPPSWQASGYSIRVDESSPGDGSTTTFTPGNTANSRGVTGQQLTDFVADDNDYDETLAYSIIQISAGSVNVATNLFTIDSGARTLALNGQLSYESITAYAIQVQVTDSGSNPSRTPARVPARDENGQDLGPLTAATSVLVTVLDNNEPPVFQSANMTHPETSSSFVFRFDLDKLTSDPDLGRSSFLWTMDAELPAGLNRFEVVDDLLRLREEFSQLDYENCEEHTVTITVNDRWQTVVRANAPSQQRDSMVDDSDLTDSATFVVTVTDENDISVPVLNDTNYVFSSGGGERVVLVASDLGPTDFKCGSGGCALGVDYEYLVEYGPAPSGEYYRATGCDRVLGQGNGAIACSTAQGVGTGHVWRISVTDVRTGKTTVSPFSTTTSAYQAPRLDLLSSDSMLMPTEGGVEVVLSGTNFGPACARTCAHIDVFYVSRASQTFNRYQATGCEVSAATSRIKCITAPGVGKDIQWCLQVGGQYADAWCSTYSAGGQPGVSSHNVSSAAASSCTGVACTSSYSPPSVVDIDGNTTDTDVHRFRGRGGEPFDITGRNFGPLGTAVALSYGPVSGSSGRGPGGRYTAVGCQVTVAHSKIRCTSVAGNGFDHASFVFAGGQQAEDQFVGRLISYRPPQIVSVGGTGANGASTSGGASITITGENFGPAFTTVSQPCEFENPIVTTDQTDFYAADLAAHYGLDPNATAIPGVTYNAECCRVESDDRIVCKTAQGTGFGHAWTLRVGGRWSNVYDAQTSYARPVVTEYENYPTRLVNVVDQYNTSGGEDIVIVGKNFGFLNSRLDSLTYGMLTDTEFVIDPATCDIIVPHLKIKCPLIPGAGFDISWRVVVDRQASVYPTSAYGRPVVTGFSVADSSVLTTPIDALNTHGGQTIVIHGQNFGPRTDFIDKITYGPNGRHYRAQNCSILTPSFQIVCDTVPGVGENHVWLVTIRGQTNILRTDTGDVEPTTSYARPQILEVVPRHGPTNGGVEITLIGRHFGALDVASDLGVGVFFGGYSSQMLGCLEFGVRRGQQNPTVPNPNTVLNNETISFMLPEYHSAGHPIQVAVGSNTCPPQSCATCPAALYAVSSSASDGSAATFDYDPPEIELIQIRSFAGANTNSSDKVLIIEGRNFCRGETCGAVWIGPLVGADNNTVTRQRTRDGSETKASVACPQYDDSVVKCEFTHNRISLIVPLPGGLHGDEGTVWVSAGFKAAGDSEPMAVQITNTDERPPKQYRFVSPQISYGNMTQLGAMEFDSLGGCEVFIFGRFFGDIEEDLCVTVGQCIPRPQVCGNPCYGADGMTVVGVSTPITAGSLSDPMIYVNDQGVQLPDYGSFSFKTPPFTGQYQDFFVWRDDQASVNDFVDKDRPHSSIREFTLSYRRPGSEQNPDFGVVTKVAGLGAGNCGALSNSGSVSATCGPDSCRKEFSDGSATCIDPKCYESSPPVIKLAGTETVVSEIPTTGAFVDVHSSQLGQATPTTFAPSESHIVVGAFYKQTDACLDKLGCNWIDAVHQYEPRCSCLYNNLEIRPPDIFSSPAPPAPAGFTQTWTDSVISNVWVPPGSGTGYMLQVFANGAPSAPVPLSYADPTIASVVDQSQNSLPAMGGTSGGTLLTITGSNFGCMPDAGTVAGSMSADGVLTRSELIDILGTARLADDVLREFDASFDPDDPAAADGISRSEFGHIEQKGDVFADVPAPGVPLNLCQGVPEVLLQRSDTTPPVAFPCTVVSLAHNQIVCNTTAGEGEKLDVLVTPAGNAWDIDPATGAAVNGTLFLSGGQTAVQRQAFSYRVPRVTSIETNVPATLSDCEALFGHSCGPSSALVDVFVEDSSLGGNGTQMPSGDNQTLVTRPVFLTIRGANFGRPGNAGAPLTVELVCADGAEHCVDGALALDPATVERTQEQVRVQLSPGIGANLAVRVSVGGQTNTISPASRFTYLAPRVTSVYPDFGRTNEFMTEEDKKDGRFFHRRFAQGDTSPADGFLFRSELQSLLSLSEALRVVVDLTARDADRIFDDLDFDRSGNLTVAEFVRVSFSSTDGCEIGAFESLTQWQDRVAQASAAERAANPRAFERACLKPRTMIFYGENLGVLRPGEILPSMTRLWLGECERLTTEMTCDSLERCRWDGNGCVSQSDAFKGIFDIYDQRTALAESKCMELSAYDALRQTWLSTCSPPGIGTNHTMFVSVEGRQDGSESVKWNYGLPIITSSQPRPYNAKGDAIVILGENLGAVASPATVEIAGMPCQDASWEPSYVSDGRPYLSCRAQLDVVGAKTVTVRVAEQDSAAANALPDTDNVTRQLSRFHSVCQAGSPDPTTGVERVYYGKPGQLCTLCPPGAVCLRGTYAEPTSMGGFWHDRLDLTEKGGESLVTATEPVVDDQLGSRAIDDIQRALGATSGDDDTARFPACSPERVLRVFRAAGGDEEASPLSDPARVSARADAAQMYERLEAAAASTKVSVGDTVALAKLLEAGFPHALADDRCSNFVACSPPDACNASNTCNEAYKHTEVKCREWEVDQPDSMIACNTTMQCHARSGGSSCMQAVQEVCACPREWSPEGAFSCSKNCLRDSGKRAALSAAGCDPELMNGYLARLPPLSKDFMNGAVCRRTLNETALALDPDGASGFCECAPSPRCALCTSGTYYRVSGGTFCVIVASVFCALSSKILGQLLYTHASRIISLHSCVLPVLFILLGFFSFPNTKLGALIIYRAQNAYRAHKILK